MEIDLQIGQIENTDCLSSFFCGIEELDSFIHNNLIYSIRGHYCKACAVYRGDSEEVVAFFALNYDSLELSQDEKWNILYPCADSGRQPLDVAIDYEELFKNKLSYPALEISYLAVRKDLRRKKLGTRILLEIHKMILEKSIAGCQFVTVMAYKSDSYSAEGFYKKCGFCHVNGGGANTVRMYSPLYRV